MIKLRITIGEAQELCEFAEESITVGRSENNLVQLDSQKISRNHAVIERTEDGYKVRDLGSRNGILVNQNRVEFALLAPGDVVKIGDALFLVEDCPKPKKRTWKQPVPGAIHPGDEPAAKSDAGGTELPGPTDPESEVAHGGESEDGREARAAEDEAAEEPRDEARSPLETGPDSEEIRGETPVMLDQVCGWAETIAAHCRDKVKGRDPVIEQVVIALFAGGHILIDDYPGSGTTTLVKALADALIRDEGSGPGRLFSRISCTPDLLPMDVTGAAGPGGTPTGPIFSNLLLADDFNRAAAKAQAVLLEAMEEKQVTVQGETHPLGDLFCVIATQGSPETVGAQPLTPAQRDRFLIRIGLEPLSAEQEMEVLVHARRPDTAARAGKVRVRDLVDARPTICGTIVTPPEIHRLLVAISQAIRQDARVLQGISTGALVLAVPALQARAMLYGRDRVVPEDVGALATALFSHRVVLKSGADGPDRVVAEVTANVLKRDVSS